MHWEYLVDDEPVEGKDLVIYPNVSSHGPHWALWRQR